MTCCAAVHHRAEELVSRTAYTPKKSEEVGKRNLYTKKVARANGLEDRLASKETY